MERAVLLIGISQARGLPELPAVGSGIAAMAEWARDQGLPDERITTLTDLEGEPVSITAVCAAVKAFIATRAIEQLVIHFCGHGMVVDGSEVWLLSGATEYGHEAVSVVKSKLAAEHGKIPHVVMVSDACRTPPETLADAATAGSSMFPIERHGNRSYVDLFFATRRGAPALQVAAEGSRYHAVYTEVLAEALQGAYANVLEAVEDEEGYAQLVRVGPLYQALPSLVAARLQTLKTTAAQQPDGAITFDTGPRWISRLRSGPDSLDLGSVDVGGDGPSAGDALPVSDPLEEQARAAATRLAALPDPRARVGVRVTGANVLAANAGYVPVRWAGQEVTVDIGSMSPWSVVMRLDDEKLLTVPVFHDRVATVVMEQGELVDVVYTSSYNPSPIDEERAWMGAASRWVLPWWGSASPEELITRHEDRMIEDPSAAILVAHALLDMGRLDLVTELYRLLGRRSLPDIVLMCGPYLARPPKGVPMFSRTWPLLGDDGLAPLPPPLPRIQSPWTLFAGPGTDSLLDVVDPRR